MVDNQRLGLGGVFVRDGSALRALFGVGQRSVVSRRTDGRRVGADSNPRFVHHLEHITQASVLFSHQIAQTIGIRTKHEAVSYTHLCHCRA